MHHATFVTSFFDLGRLEDRKERTWAFYRDNARWLFDLGLPMVAFLEHDHLEEMRGLYPRQNIEWIASRPAIDKRYVLKIAENLERAGGREWKGSPRYFAMTREKMALLARAAEYNPHRSQRFYWVDFGIGYIPNLPRIDSASTLMMLQREVENEQRGIRVCAIDYIPGHVFRDRPLYYGKNWWPMASGFFGGPADKLLLLNYWFQQEWERVVHEGYVPFDERIHGWLMHQRPEMYTRHYGDHFSCVANTFSGHHSRDLVFDMANRARYFGDVGEANRRFNWAARDMTPVDWRCST